MRCKDCERGLTDRDLHHRYTRCDACRSKARIAARQGDSPDHDMVHRVPEGFHIRGVSTLYRDDGTIGAQWVKSAIDEDHKMQALMDAMQTLAEPFKGLAEPVAPPALAREDLLAVYAMGDPHVGLYAWAAESGDDHDLKIAENDLVTAIDQLVGLAPSSDRALICQLGDFLHGDSKRNETTKGTPVDMDTRYPKVLAVGIRIMVQLIDRALEKHSQVTVVNCIGNHDEQSSIMLSLCLANYYAREPRVLIDTSPNQFHWYRFGSNLLGITHGNTTKMDQLPAIMACDRAKDWGETKHRAWMIGHVHHQNVKEYPGVTVESFRTIAPADQWHTASGYRSGRDMICDVWHRDFGRVTRHVVGIVQIRAAQVK